MGVAEVVRLLNSANVRLQDQKSYDFCYVPYSPSGSSRYVYPFSPSS